MDVLGQAREFHQAASVLAFNINTVSDTPAAIHRKRRQL